MLQIFVWLGGISSRIANICKYLFGNSQALGVLVVAVNRYTAFMMPLRHKQLCRDGKLLTWSIAGSWIIAFLSIIPIMFIFEYKIYISEDDPTNRTIFLQWTNPTHLLCYALPVIIIGKGLIILFVFIFYGIIFAVTFKTRRSTARAATKAEKAALNMSIVGFAHCIGLAIALIFFIAQEIAWFGQSSTAVTLSTQSHERSTIGSMKVFVVLVLCAVGAFAVPTRFRREEPVQQALETCATQCSGAETKFKYAPGKAYEYDLKSETKVQLGGNQAQTTVVQTATVTINVQSPCELSMKLSNVKLTGADVPSTWASNLEKLPLRFSFEDGMVSNVCPQADEETWSLNIKRAILSTFQNALEGQDNE
uniref:G-protein coupled receptors family 1 profile domain-containing protein n=1 Tax=Plectus sambesii TaxID=2011161 RepID=A0A914V7X7_9BILA